MEQTHDLQNMPRFQVGEHVAVNGVTFVIAEIDGERLTLERYDRDAAIASTIERELLGTLRMLDPGRIPAD